MNKKLSYLLFFICASCAKPYYGYSESEWKNLSKKEKTAIKAEYQGVVDAKNAQQHADLIDSRRQQIIEIGADAQ